MSRAGGRTHRITRLDHRMSWAPERPGQLRKYPEQRKKPVSAKRRGRPSVKPPLDVDQVLRWADAHHARTGQWPQPASGVIHEAVGETWRNLDHAMRKGQRGLPQTSLTRLLHEHRGVARTIRRELTLNEVLSWAKAWKARTGRWPTVRSGPIPEAPGLNWRALDQALRQGSHGLPAGSSLARLLNARPSA